MSNIKPASTPRFDGATPNLEPPAGKPIAKVKPELLDKIVVLKLNMRDELTKESFAFKVGDVDKAVDSFGQDALAVTVALKPTIDVSNKKLLREYRGYAYDALEKLVYGSNPSNKQLNNLSHQYIDAEGNGNAVLLFPTTARSDR